MLDIKAQDILLLPWRQGDPNVNLIESSNLICVDMKDGETLTLGHINGHLGLEESGKIVKSIVDAHNAKLGDSKNYDAQKGT